MEGCLRALADLRMSVRSVDSRRVTCIALCVMLLGILRSGMAAQDGSPTVSSRDNDSHYSLTGTVINSVTGEPLRRAAVQMAGQSGSATLTDDSGHFQFDGLPQGQFFVTAMKPGYYENGPGATGVTLGRDTAAVVLKLTPCGVIAGRVTTRDGKPLEGFRISLIAKEILSGRKTWVERPAQGITNEDGEYRVAGLSADTYYVGVDSGQQTSLGEPGVVNAREQGYARVFYPGVSELSAASPIEVVPGQELEANFSLTPEPLYQVSGVVPQAVTGLQFERKTGGEADFSAMAGIQDGRFQAKLPAGSYVVSGSTVQGTSLSTPGASVVISADNADVHVPLAATASIPVRILAEHAGPGAGERVLPEQIPGLRIELESASHMARMKRWWNVQAGAIENVAPGAYMLRVQMAAPWWVKSAQCAGVNVLVDDFTVTDAGSSPPIEITLRDDAGFVTGTVSGAGQWPEVMVLLVPAQGNKNNIDQTIATMGAFSFQGVAPGDYAIVALDHGEQVEFANPDVLSPYLSGAQQVHVPARGTATVNLTVTPVRR